MGHARGEGGVVLTVQRHAHEGHVASGGSASEGSWWQPVAAVAGAAGGVRD